MNALSLRASRVARCLVLLAVVSRGGAAAQPAPVEKVVVSGAAEIVSTPAAARERALQQALRLAVEQVAGVLVESETLSRNLALFEDNILTRTEGYVRDYRVLAEREEQGALVLDVEVEVAPGRLTDDLASLGILLRRAGYPLVSVELFATGARELPPDVGTRLETELRALLAERGFEVVQPNGRGADAVVRIEGTLEWSDLGDPAGVGMSSALASASLQAVDAASGSVLATARARGRAAGLGAADARDRAGVQALESSAVELGDGLVRTWSSRVNNGDVVLLSVRGIESFDEVAALADMVGRRFEETTGIVQRQVAVDRGVALLEWRGRSSASVLARWLAGKDVGGRPLAVVGAGGSMVQLEIRRR